MTQNLGGSTSARVSRVSAAAIARATGLSSATVSYVLNERPGVSSETRQRVLDAAGLLGYSLPPHLDGSTNRAHIVGLILSTVANPFYPELSTGFYEAAERRGYQVFLAHTDDDQASLGGAINAMIDRSVDGIAIAIARTDTADVVRVARRHHVPIVQISRRFAHVDADFVGIDDRSAAAEMMDHAIGHGRGPIATVIGQRTSSASAAREESFVGRAHELGIDIPKSRRVSTDLTLEGGQAAATHLFSSDNPPQFVLCGSDILALGVMAEAHRRGLRVPEDVAVTGFDGIELAATPMIDLTGVVQPRRRMSSTALDLLVDRIERTSSTTLTRTVPHALRIGRTCGCTQEGESA
jgi:LacI family transcriptional regulator